MSLCRVRKLAIPGFAPSGLALLSPVLGSRYGGKRERREFLPTPLEAGEHWSEQAKPKGAATDGSAFTREAGRLVCEAAQRVKRGAEPEGPADGGVLSFRPFSLDEQRKGARVRGGTRPLE